MISGGVVCGALKEYASPSLSSLCGNIRWAVEIPAHSELDWDLSLKPSESENIVAGSTELSTVPVRMQLKFPERKAEECTWIDCLLSISGHNDGCTGVGVRRRERWGALGLKYVHQWSSDRKPWIVNHRARAGVLILLQLQNGTVVLKLNATPFFGMKDSTLRIFVLTSGAFRIRRMPVVWAAVWVWVNELIVGSSIWSMYRHQKPFWAALLEIEMLLARLVEFEGARLISLSSFSSGRIEKPKGQTLLSDVEAKNGMMGAKALKVDDHFELFPLYLYQYHRADAVQIGVLTPSLDWQGVVDLTG
ncbi:hypothetical protein FB451DRAFT_1183076 [Mycena latifolia]|nr:hypothetical protein FB451DRAFT_1183076 [Mycena latifolia]